MMGMINTYMRGCWISSVKMLSLTSTKNKRNVKFIKEITYTLISQLFKLICIHQQTTYLNLEHKVSMNN